MILSDRTALQWPLAQSMEQVISHNLHLERRVILDRYACRLPNQAPARPPPSCLTLCKLQTVNS
jgi:hypothetical protein